MGEHTRIIIVDDDEGIRETLAAILQEEGYQVDTAENGKEAIEKTNAKFYNLALIDIRLPDIEGIDLLKEIKETVPKIRKIIITGYPTLQNAIEAVNSGADAYVLKPFDIEKVLKIIKVELEKQGDEKKYSQEKVTEFIETRVKELEKEKTITRK
ncbi:MAG TPA: response regulator [Candidatus Krumholzibacteriaceae bacterium]|jgi:DNA-binding NtrC family response regulator|nr:response regulator [Candidatus Krumholzibacteriaceae bacterium]